MWTARNSGLLLFWGTCSLPGFMVRWRGAGRGDCEGGWGREEGECGREGYLPRFMVRWRGGIVREGGGEKKESGGGRKENGEGGRERKKVIYSTT